MWKCICLLTVMIQCWSLRPIAVWPLGKLYSGFDLSGRRYDLHYVHSRAAKYVEGPDGLPYSAHEIKTETSKSYLEFRPKFNTLSIFETIQYSYTILVYFLYDVVLTELIFMVDFRCPHSDSHKGLEPRDRIQSYIETGKVMRIFVSDQCNTRSFWRNLQPGKWYFISFAYDGKTGLVQTSVNGAFKEYTNPGCVNEVGRMSNCLHLGNNPHRRKQSVKGSTHRFACFEIHDGFLTPGELLKRQERCIGRGR
jgi:hypothetical protein